MVNIGEIVGFGALAAMGATFFVIALAVYVYFALALMAIAKKTNTQNGWLAFIPIANIYLMTQIAGLPSWYTLGVLLPIIPFLGQLAFLALMVYFWWKIAEAISEPGWWGILFIIPIVNLVIVGIMAWGKTEAKPVKTK